MNNVFGNTATAQAYPAFIESIGSHLSAVGVSETGLHEGDIFKAVIASCPNVKHLTLRGCNLLDPYLVPLFDTLDGDLGLQLLTLI